MEPCSPLGFLALYIMPLICVESERVGGTELYLAAILLSSRSDAQELGACGMRQPLCMTSTEVEACPWPQTGIHKDKGVLPDLCPHFCDPEREVGLTNRTLLSCVQGCHHEMAFEVSFWRIEVL